MDGRANEGVAYHSHARAPVIRHGFEDALVRLLEYTAEEAEAGRCRLGLRVVSRALSVKASLLVRMCSTSSKQSEVSPAS